MKRICFALALLGLVLTSGCIVREGRGGGHDPYWHDYGHYEHEHWEHHD
jgi:hypothetical protein